MKIGSELHRIAREIGGMDDLAINLEEQVTPSCGNVFADMGLPEEDVRLGEALNAYYRLNILARGLTMPRGARYAVRWAEGQRFVTVILVSKRNFLHWPNWDKMASLVICERIVEDVDPDNRCQRKTLYF